MKTVLLLRHAKSDRAAGIDDKERPLNDRGRKTAPVMARAMRARDFVPELALVSSAERTRETWALVAPELGADLAVEFRDELYLAPASRLIETLRALDAAIGTALLIGHNPGIEETAARLAASKQHGAVKDAVKALAEKFPTCALAVLRFKIDDWAKLRTGAGELVAFLTPASVDKRLDG